MYLLIKNIFKISAYPLMMGSTMYFACTEFSVYSLPYVTMAIFSIFLISAVLLERSFPYEKNWNRPWHENALDIKYFIIIQPAVKVAEIIAYSFGTYLAVNYSVLFTSTWLISHQPLFVQFLAALVIADFPIYIFHRACHVSDGFLWRMHSLHHQPDYLYSINFSRFHPLNVFINSFITLFPLVVLGTPAFVIFLVAIFQKTHGVLTHTNFDFKLGPLNFIISMAENHRFHHAKNGNYGSTLIIWDLLFGTYIKNYRKNQRVILNSAISKNASLWNEIFSVFFRNKVNS